MNKTFDEKHTKVPNSMLVSRFGKFSKGGCFRPGGSLDENKVNLMNGSHFIRLGIVFVMTAILSFSAFVIPTPAYAGGKGEAGATFLKIAVGSRPAAMGKAYTAVAEGPYALHYNPASIINASRWELSAMHQDQFGQINFDYLGFAVPLNVEKSALGFSLVRLASEDQFRTEIEDLGTFTNQDLALTGTYARRVLKPLTLGFSGKYIRQSLANIDANGWALDFGAHLVINPRISLGMSLLNLGPKITFITIGDPLPTTFRFGSAVRLLPRGNLLATADMVKTRDDSDYLGVGFEYRPGRFMAFRAGYQFGTDFKGFDASTYGLTFNFRNFGMEYAYVPREKLGNIHRAGLNMAFGGQKEKPVTASSRSRNRAKVLERVRRNRAKTRRTGEVEWRDERYSGPNDVQQVVVEKSVELPVRGDAEPVVVNEEVLQKKAEPVIVEPEKVIEEVVEDKKPEPQATKTTGSLDSYWDNRTDVVEPESNVNVEVEGTVDIYRMPVEAVPEPSLATDDSTSDAVRPIEKEISQIITAARPFVDKGLHEEAVVMIRKGLSEYPYSIHLWYLLSEAYYGMNRYDEALDAVDKALEIIRVTETPAK